jgi:hypothetical protein
MLDARNRGFGSFVTEPAVRPGRAAGFAGTTPAGGR